MSVFLLAHRASRRALARDVAALFSFAVFASPAAQAQSVNDGASQSVVVTGTRTPQRVDQALAEVTVIDRAQIEAAAGRTLAELLAREAGVQFSSNGGLGKSSSVSLRGLEARHTLLLIDGVRYGSATLGTPSFENLPVDAIDRIEIVRGPLSGLYGSDAVGGVIQIFTRKGAAGFTPDAAVKAGSNRYADAAAGLRFGAGAFDGAVRAQHVRQRGVSATNERVPFDNFNADDDGFRQSSVSAQGGVKFGAWRAEASLLASRGRTQYDDGPGADSRAALRSEIFSANVGGPIVGEWRSNLRVARSKDDYETLASASEFASLGTISTEQNQLSWENTVATPLGTMLALTERLQQKVSRPEEAFAVSERSITAVALGLNGQVGVHGWQANLRHDRNSQFGKQNTGSLAYGLEVAPGVRVAASHGTSFVAPSFNQLYFPGFGNPDLQPEEGRQSEFSLRWLFDGGSARLAYFDNRIRGYIASGPAPTNIPRTRIDGVSASVDAVAGAWNVSASFDIVNPINDSAGSPNFGKQLPRRASEIGRAAADWRGGAWTLGGTLAAHGGRFDDTANTDRLDGYAVLDLRADWRLAADWRLGLALNNAFGKRYETVRGYNQPGREAFVGLRWAPR
jgi:vitamin B12 transporter